MCIRLFAAWMQLDVLRYCFKATMTVSHIFSQVHLMSSTCPSAGYGEGFYKTYVKKQLWYFTFSNLHNCYFLKQLQIDIRTFFFKLHASFFIACSASLFCVFHSPLRSRPWYTTVDKAKAETGLETAPQLWCLRGIHHCRCNGKVQSPQLCFLPSEAFESQVLWKLQSEQKGLSPCGLCNGR